MSYCVLHGPRDFALMPRVFVAFLMGIVNGVYEMCARISRMTVLDVLAFKYRIGSNWGFGCIRHYGGFGLNMDGYWGL